MDPRIKIYEELSKRFSIFRVHSNSKDAAQKEWQRYCHAKIPFNKYAFIDPAGQAMNAGIACGPANGVIIVDTDDLELFQNWCTENNISDPTPDTFTVTSGGKSNHYYYLYPKDGNEYRKCKVPGVDLIGIGGYAVAPGSIHPDTGKPYFISNDIPIAQAPQWVLDAMLNKIPRKLAKKPSQDNQQMLIVQSDTNAVSEGERNNYLASVVGDLINKGLSSAAIKAALIQENTSVCNPPLEMDEVEKIYNSIISYPKSKYIILTHEGFADAFVKEHLEKIKYDYQAEEWYIWDGKRWKEDKPGNISNILKIFNRNIYQQGCTISDDYGKALKKKSREYENGNNFDHILNKVKTDPAISVPSNIFDNDSSKLNCINGTIDLKTGTLIPHNPLDLNTKMIEIEYNPNAQAPVFERFLNDIMDGNPELIDYMNKVAGYSATGETKEQCYFIAYGTGGNGKTTLMNALKGVLGVFATDISFKTLINHNDRSREDLAKTVGVRFLTSSEVDPNKAMDETVINRITGNETFTARWMYKHVFDFTPQFKLFIFGNHKPSLQSINYATRRRIRLIPFNRCFKGKDRNKDLPDELKKEYPGILRWIVEGARKWYESGLETPDIVENEIQDYIEEIDTIAKFLESDFEQDNPNAIFPCSEFNQRYKQWCNQNDEVPLGKQNVTEALRDKGFLKKKTGGREQWVGIRRKGQIVLPK
jgi:P4 family phage/plasmid primase-like protien